MHCKVEIALAQGRSLGPAGRTHQRSSQGSRTIHVQQPEAIARHADHVGDPAVRSTRYRSRVSYLLRRPTHSGPHRGNRSGRRRPAAQARQSGELTGKMLEFTLSTRPRTQSARLLLVGAGKREQWSSAALRKIAGASLRFLKARSVKNFALFVREGQRHEENAKHRRGRTHGQFESDKYKTTGKTTRTLSLPRCWLFQCGTRCGDKGLSKGRIIADAQNFARDLVNEPSNKLTPRILAEKAKPWPRGPASPSKSSTKKRLPAQDGALLSVAQGARAARVMVVTYTPANPKPGARSSVSSAKRHVDTGGISIKPSEAWKK